MGRSVSVGLLLDDFHALIGWMDILTPSRTTTMSHQVLDRWVRLLKGLRIQQDLKRKYAGGGGAGDAGGAGGGRSSSSKATQKKKRPPVLVDVDVGEEEEDGEATESEGEGKAG